MRGCCLERRDARRECMRGTAVWLVALVAVATLGTQAYVAGSPVGTELTNTSEPTADTTETLTVAGLTRADLDALSIRVRVSRPGGNNPAFTARLDAVSVTVDYTTTAVATAPTYDDNGNMLTDGTYGNRTYTYDPLGRLTGVTGSGVAATYTLDGAGNRWAETINGVTTSFDLIGYAGEWKNATGLVHLRARDYDPVMARFVGRDPFAGVVSAPQTGNRYASGLGNPFRYTDPSGHFVQAALANPGFTTSFGPATWVVDVVPNCHQNGDMTETKPAPRPRHRLTADVPEATDLHVRQVAALYYRGVVSDAVTASLETFRWVLDALHRGKRVVAADPGSLPDAYEEPVIAGLPRPEADWVWLVRRDHPWRRQLWVKGRSLTAGDLARTIEIERWTPEQAAHEYEIPLEAVIEAQRYAETARDLIAAEEAENRIVAQRYERRVAALP